MQIAQNSNIYNQASKQGGANRGNNGQFSFRKFSKNMFNCYVQNQATIILPPRKISWLLLCLQLQENC